MQKKDFEMQVLSKYVLKQLTGSFIVVILGLTLLIWLTQSLKMIDMVVSKGVSARIFLEMTFLVLPSFIQILTPIALFAVVLFVYSRMYTDKELMVMQASGMANFTILAPALLFATILTIIGYFFSLYLVPVSYSKLREMKWQIKNNLVNLVFQEGQFTPIQKGLTVYVKERAEDGIVKGLILYDTRKENKIVSMVAEQGILFQEGEGIQILLNKGVRQEFNKVKKQFSTLKFDKYTMAFDDKNMASGRIGDVRELKLKTLLFTSEKSTLSESRYRRYRVEAFKRLMYPLYNFTFVFIAALGVLCGTYNRRGHMKQIYCALMLALLVQSFSLLFENLTNKNLFFFVFMVANIFAPIVFIVRGLNIKLFFKKMVILFLISFSFCTFAHALDFNRMPKVDDQRPLDFEADFVEYDKDKNEIQAYGNVIVSQETMKLYTQKIIFNQTEDKLYCPDKTKIVSSDGSVMQVQEIYLSGDLKEGVAKEILLKLSDGSNLSAKKMSRKKEGTRMLFRDVSYTSCKMCDGKEPLWEIESKKVVLKKDENKMTYQNSFFTIKGVPVFYFPYLSIPDFNVKRKTGFLSPSLVHNSVMGTGIQTPFFLDIAENQNFVFTPLISVSHMPLVMMDYQGVFKKGILNLSVSGTRADDDKNVGHIKGHFEYDINNKWRLSGNIFRVSEDTYFRRYNIPNIDEQQPFLTSDLTVERFGQRNYFSAKSLYFQSLVEGRAELETPYVIPLINYRYQTKNLNNTSLYGFSEINSAFIRNTSRFQSDRITAIQGLKLPFVFSSGIGGDITASVRTDGYHIKTGNKSFSYFKEQQSSNVGRFSENISATFNYPLMKYNKNFTQILEPIVMLVYSNYSNSSYKIPNVDSQDFDFDDTNLFARNRFSGYDRIEKGTRVNYGVKWSAYGEKLPSISTLFGQVYQIEKDKEIAPLMGVERHLSDYVGRVQIDYNKLNLSYRFRLDQETLQSRKNEIGIAVGDHKKRLGIDYSYIKEIKGNEYAYSYPTREEIKVYGHAQITPDWMLAAEYRYNLAKMGGPIEWITLLRYDNECAAVEFEFDKSYAKDRNYKGDTSFKVNFILKNLGGK